MKDFLQLFKILTYDIWLYKKSEKKIWRKVSWKIVEFHRIKGCVQKVILEKKVSKSESI